MTRSRELLMAVFLVSAIHPSEPFVRQDDRPGALLERAERLAWLTDWYAATPLYRGAEAGFLQHGDARGAMYARFGRVRGEMQIRPLPEISEQLAADLATPLARDDQRLRLRGLTVKGDVDLEWNVPEARRDWEQVRALAQALDEKGWANRATGELGMIAFMQGDTGGARTLIEEAFRAAWWSGDVGAQLRYMGSIANGLLQAGYPNAAMGWIEKALAFAKKHPETGFPYVVYSTHALTLLRLNRPDEAERIVQTALVYARLGDRRIKEVELLVMLANVANRRNQPQQAIQHLEQAVSRARSGGVQRLLADAQEDLARAYRRMGHLAVAEQHATAAVRDTEASGNQFALPARLAALADIHAARGALSEADDLYQRAADVVEMVMLNVPSPTAQARLIGVTSDVFLGHFRVAAAQQQPARAFTILERARGRAITDLLRVATHREEASPAVREQMQRVSRLQGRLLGATSATERQTLLDALWEAEQGILPERMASRAALASSRSPLTVSNLRRTLRPDEVLLEYVLDEPQSFCLVLSRHEQHIVPLASRKVLEPLADAFVQAIRTAPRTAGAGSALYDAVLAPILRPQATRRVIVVPDGRLHLVPFDALLRLRVADALTVSVTPSASVLYLLRTTAPAGVAPLRPLLAIGGVPYDRAQTVPALNAERSADLRGLFDAAQPAKLTPLPTARSEVLSAARLMGVESEALTGDGATESALKAKPLDRFNVLHFAVHGIVDPKFPDRAALVLLGDAEGGEDGLLQPREISRMPLNASIVVLSACNTAVGPTLGQEGTLNLARAFLLAGARSVVTTLWTVNDATSTTLMTRFYERLAAGDEVADALGKAKTAVIDTFGPDALPTISAFQLLGDTEAVAVHAASAQTQRSASGTRAGATLRPGGPDDAR